MLIPLATNFMNDLTLVRSHMLGISVIKHSLINTALSGMSAHTLERSLTNAVTAVNPLLRDVSCSYMRGHTLERYPTSVHSVKRNSAAGRNSTSTW